MRLRSLPDRGRRAFERLLRRLSRTDERVATFESATGSGRPRALLCYIVDPHLVPAHRSLPTSHTNFWESREIGRILSELGFDLDVVHWNNRTFRPVRAYDLVIDVRVLLERIAPQLGERCLKLMHLETAHASFYNPAQLARLAALEARRGIRLPPYKTIDDNRGIELAEAATILGNEATRSTYAFADKPLYPVPISQPVLHEFPIAKDYEACRRRFLWLGSAGMVHKGLDLALEAFSGLPDYQLTVCGPVDRERSFEAAFERELYRTPNIETIGWIDVTGPEFVALANRTLGLVYPSCSEGQNGGTVSCLHASLIPIVTRETGVDVDAGFGSVLDAADPDSIRKAVVDLSSRPAPELALMARRGWEWVRSHHTRERFSTEYRRSLLEIVDRFRPALRRRLEV